MITKIEKIIFMWLCVIIIILFGILSIASFLRLLEVSESGTLSLETIIQIAILVIGLNIGLISIACFVICFIRAMKTL